MTDCAYLRNISLLRDGRVSRALGEVVKDHFTLRNPDGFQQCELVRVGGGVATVS